MDESVIKWHEELREMKKISPILMQRKTGQTYEISVQLSSLINMLRHMEARVLAREFEGYGH
jgi:hypothetical protein